MLTHSMIRDCVLILVALVGLASSAGAVLATSASSKVVKGALLDRAFAQAQKYRARRQRNEQRAFQRGAKQVVISLRRQSLSVYKDGVRIRRTRVSTGKNGHRTPTGIFSTIQKRRRHYSNIYNGAPMPYMQRLTWSGIALHQGPVPRYRASHGCVRLPGSFARYLFRALPRRSHVVIAHGNPVPRPFSHDLLFKPTSTDTFAMLREVAKVDRGGGGARAPHGQTHSVAYTHGGASAGEMTTTYQGAEGHGAAQEAARAPAMAAMDRSESMAARISQFRSRSFAPLRVLIRRVARRVIIREVPAAAGGAWPLSRRR